MSVASPQRAGVEFLQAAVALELGDAGRALARMLEADNPDVSLFVGRRLLQLARPGEPR